MAGLRLRNKEDRNRRILENAATQFRDAGYDDVKIEAIAAAADVSVGTIYNYYKNKGDILVSIVSMEVGDVLALGEKILAQPPKDAVQAINQLTAGYLDHSLTYLSKAMWRQAMAIAMAQPNSPSGEIYANMDKALADQTARMVEKLVKIGLLRRDIDAKVFGRILFHNMDNMFINFVKNDDMSLASLKSELRCSNRAIVKLIAA
jgi:AcrR family transcriptional regulator